MENNNRTKIIVIVLIGVVVVLLVAITLLSQIKKTAVISNNQTTQVKENDKQNNSTNKITNRQSSSETTNVSISPTPSSITRKIQSLTIPEVINSPQTALNSTDTPKKTITWLSSFRTSKAEYPSTGLQCTFNSQGADCISPVETFSDSRIGIVVMWAKYKNGDIINIDQDLDQYLTREYQIDFWHCRFLYEMSQSNFFSTNQKDKLKNICLSTVRYETTEWENNNLQSVDPNNFIVNQNPLINPITSNSIFRIYATHASDFVARYLWFKNPNDLKIAKKYFDRALTHYQYSKNATVDYMPLLAVASLDMYKATNNKEYLQFSQSLNQLMNSDFGDTITYILKVILQKDLYQITSNTNDKQMMQKNLDFIFTNAYDYGKYTDGFKGTLNNNGAFHNLSRITFSYNILDNALMSGILLDIK